jgi:hypothetical protein
MSKKRSPSLGVHRVVITQSKSQILDRMQRGELLRWVPCSMIGIQPAIKGQRALFLGKDLLDDVSGLDVIRLEHDKKIVAIEDDSGVCDYVLS